MERVRKGEQADPTGQYSRKGLPIARQAGNTGLVRRKWDAAKGKLPFALHADGTVVLLPQTVSGNETNIVQPIETCTEGCGTTYVPVVSTFTTSVGQGGTGPIVDLKVAIDKPIFPGYTLLDADLNRGNSGRDIYYQFTRDGSSVLKGLEYNSPNFGFTTSDPIMSFYTGTGTWHSQPRTPVYYSVIWNPNNNPNVYWNTLDLNAGAGGAYVYSYQSKDTRSVNAVIFQEIGILSGNSPSIEPPAGWVKWPYDLNEDAGGDFIYFCYHP